MRYPTPVEVEVADQEQIYFWLMLLPFPRVVKDKKTKIYFVEPPGGVKILDRIRERWLGFGGYDIDLAYGVMGHAST
jgi:hypothetical protein